jgi:hypothetical protein
MVTDHKKADFELKLFENTTTDDHYADFSIVQINKAKVEVSNDGKVTEQVKNLYEVCGQAQKSVHWKHNFIRSNRKLSERSCWNKS